LVKGVEVVGVQRWSRLIATVDVGSDEGGWLVTFPDQTIFNKIAERCGWSGRQLFYSEFVVVHFLIGSRGVLQYGELVVVEGFINIIFEAGWDLRGRKDW
jgi:hypothetical protein